MGRQRRLAGPYGECKMLIWHCRLQKSRRLVLHAQVVGLVQGHPELKGLADVEDLVHVGNVELADGMTSLSSQ